MEKDELKPYSSMCRCEYEDTPERLDYYLDSQTAGLSRIIARIDKMLIKAKPDTRLISKAPEMYEAIKNIISFIDGLLRFGGIDRDNQEALVSYHRELKQAIEGVE